MCSMHHETAHVGIDFYVKLEYLSGQLRFLLERKLDIELKVGISRGWLDVNGVSRLEVALVLCVNHSLLDVNCANPTYS
jgi:hypothetical protein